MPAIGDESDGNNAFAADFSELLDLPDPDFTAFDNNLIGTTAAEADPLQCPSHPDHNDCLCNGFMGNWDLPEPNVDPFAPVEDPDYGKFENWIPQFIRPEKPCDYCQMRRLNCYVTRGENGCTPCNVLFRECTLTNTRTLEAANQSSRHLLDTLHVVDEDAAIEKGTLTGIKQLRSKTRTSGSNTTLGFRDDAPGSSKRNGIRFPHHAVKTLKDWLDAHNGNPYPTEDEKAELEKKTELKPSQIANWLANARRRRKVTEKSRPRPCTSPSLKPSTPAIAIPMNEKPWDELNPLERWKNSPPEHEPASITDIASAVANSDLPEDDQISTSPSSFGLRKKRSSNGSGFSNVRAPSTSSFETGHTSSLSASNSAVHSQHSSQSHGSFGSFSSGLQGKRDRRRRRKPTQALGRKPGDEKKRIFQCTFCTDTFKSKYDWTRHEKSLHLSLEKWICAPLGPIITDPATGNKRCVYCDEMNPSGDHLETHNHRQCDEKGMDARTFYRKDHLRQHLRLMHNCEMTPFMDNWKSTAVHINSRCGFCQQRFTIWQERVDHLTAHFKAGARMSEWKGCRGLDPAVAAQVTNAMPPYLIGIESVSPNPFSASNKATWREYVASESGAEGVETGNLGSNMGNNSGELDSIHPYGAQTNCWEILTVRLGKFANEMAKKGVVLTDEMLQTQGRRILYGSDDSWNQTAADNPEWLDLFKKAHGLDFIPTTIGGHGDQIPDDLETYGDLGLRIPFDVQLKAHNQLAQDESNKSKQTPLEHSKPTHETDSRNRLRKIYRELGREGVLTDANGKCKHTECDENILEASILDDTGTSKAKYKWCTYDLSPEKAREITQLRTPDTQDTSQAAQAFQSLDELNRRHAADEGRQRQGPDFSAAEARSRGLSSLARMEGPMMDELTVEGSNTHDLTKKKSYIQRHRYELPPHRARQFATTTGAWVDAGQMPEQISTMAPSIEQPGRTSTGAMMEFLGPNLSHTLPFNADNLSSSIPLGQDFDWNAATTAAEEAAMMQEIDQIIAETTGGQQQQSLTSQAPPMTTAEANPSIDFAMNDFNFDEMDMNFDSVFDMPMDEVFGPTGNM